jgi:hypothetical protein
VLVEQSTAVRCSPVDEKSEVVNGSVKSAGKRNEESATVGCFVSDEQRRDDEGSTRNFATETVSCLSATSK